MTRIDTDKNLIDQVLTERVIGLFFDTYNELGGGFQESVYESALAIALAESGLSIERQAAIDVWFRGQRVGEFRADLIVEERLIIEVKAVQELAAVHETQLVNYLKATSIPVGLLLNFGSKPTFRRKIFINPNLSVSSA